MPVHNVAFWFCALFLAGVFFISIFNNILIIVLTTILVCVCLVIYKKHVSAGFILFIIVGALYSSAFSKIQYLDAAQNIFNKDIEISGIITKIQQSDTSQNIVLNLIKPYVGQVKINARRYPSFNYGDLVKVKGIIKKPAAESVNYYAKEGILGIINLPQIELIESRRGSFIKAALLNFRNKIISGFKRVLPSEKAAFMAGLTLGAREDFTQEFTDKMRNSGTTHLVALSGYNISMIAIAVMALLGSFISRKVSFYFATIIIVLFVLMTGAEASVVRAAIMGIIALLAVQAQRMYSLRNAIAIAAFAMVLFNPKVLVFDVGFQLSFMALLGIVYLAPAVKTLFKIETPGFLGWRENLTQTLSAQLFVLPLLISTFGFFSLSSIFANVLILGVVPLAMGLGFMMAGFNFLSGFLAKIIGLLANIVLSYMLWIIDLFSRLSLPVPLKSFGVILALGYYAILVWFIIRYKNYERRSK